jgi:hypothetical protein
MGLLESDASNTMGIFHWAGLLDWGYSYRDTESRVLTEDT